MRFQSDPSANHRVRLQYVPVQITACARKARTDKRGMTPEVQMARDTWLKRYSATKLVIRGILEPMGKGEMLPEIFDDLAETHRAHGVTDDDVPAGDGAGQTG